MDHHNLHDIDTESWGNVFISVILFCLTYVSSHFGVFLHTATALVTVGFTVQKWYDYNKAKKTLKKKNNEKRD